MKRLARILQLSHMPNWQGAENDQNENCVKCTRGDQFQTSNSRIYLGSMCKFLLESRKHLTIAHSFVWVVLFHTNAESTHKHFSHHPARKRSEVKRIQFLAKYILHIEILDKQLRSFSLDE